MEIRIPNVGPSPRWEFTVRIEVVHRIATPPLLIVNRAERKIAARIVVPNGRSFRQLDRNSNMGKNLLTP